MPITNDTTILADSALKQIVDIGKRVAKKSPFKYEIKTQSKAITTIYMFFEDRKSGKIGTEKELRKKGADKRTGSGYAVKRVSFAGSKFGGLEYTIHYTDNSTHKIRLRFKALNANKTGKGKKTGEKKENKGILFEHELSADFKNYAKYSDPKHKSIKYKDFVEEFVKETGIEERGLYKILDMGALNQKRPLIFSGQDIFVGSRDPNIGKTVTDVTLAVGNEKRHDFLYLSLKYGATVTFMNSGVSKIFPEEDFRKRSLKNKDGKALLDLFKIDHGDFIETFMAMVKEKHKTVKKGTGEHRLVDVTQRVNMNRLHNFLKTAVGYGFYLVHAHDLGPNGHISYLEMSKSAIPRYVRPRKVVVVYPTLGMAKRIDVMIDTPKFSFKANIRNKAGGLFPTHIMLDYKIKH